MVGPAPLKSDHSHLNMWRVYTIIVILAVCTTILCKPDKTVLPNELDAACFSCSVGPCVIIIWNKDVNVTQTRDEGPPKVSAFNRTLIIGYGGSISCSISGNVTRIMWYKNGSYIAKWKTGSWNGNYFPHANGTLSIKEVKLDSDGFYDCFAFNKAGMNSARFHVDLFWPTESMKQPHTKCPRVTRDLTSQDRVTRGPTYELSAKEKITQETRWTTREKKRRTHYPVVLKVSSTCIPARSGTRLEIHCRVIAYPIPTIYWSKVGGFRKDAVKNGIIQADPYKLTIKNLDYKDRGMYKCHFSHLFGIYSYYFKVRVEDIDALCGKLHSSIISKREANADEHQWFWQRAFSHDVVKRVSGGSDVEAINQWPWQALVTYDPAVWPHSDSFCGGIIIDRDKILTAYHCTVESMKTHVFFRDRDFIVTVGVYNKTLANESTRAVYSVKRTHRLLGVKTSTDLSVLELNEEIKFTEHVRPVCLPASTQETVPPPGTECIVSGYGYTSPSGPSANILRKATVPIVSWNECKTHFSFISPGTICTASGVPAKGSCPNDSGGPLICKRSNGQWTVFGVVSGGDCLMNKAGYNFYANVVGNLNWIKNLH